MPYKRRADNPPQKTNTLLITEACNLRCAYCYEADKQKLVLPLEVAKQAVDFFRLCDGDQYSQTVWEFIGGEPLLEIGLVEEITEYIKTAYPDGNFLISITTNGTLFDDPQVRDYVSRDVCKKSVGLSLDGPRHVHNLNRSDSYDTVMANFAWWRKLYPWCATKSTVNRATLPYLAESVEFLVGLGLSQIPINLVFEEDWNAADEDAYFAQLIKIADFLADSGKYRDANVYLFNEGYLATAGARRNWCGSGTHMAAVNHKGDIYPCHRFCTERNFPALGNVFTGMDERRLYPFKLSHLKQNECGDCLHLPRCPGCLAWDYTATGTIFKKSVTLCGMFRAQIEANQYFFDKIRGQERQIKKEGDPDDSDLATE